MPALHTMEGEHTKECSSGSLFRQQDSVFIFQSGVTFIGVRCKSFSVRIRLVAPCYWYFFCRVAFEQTAIRPSKEVTSRWRAASSPGKLCTSASGYFLPKIMSESPPIGTGILQQGTFFSNSLQQHVMVLLTLPFFSHPSLRVPAAAWRPIGDGKRYLVPSPNQSLCYSRIPPTSCLCDHMLVWWSCWCSDVAQVTSLGSCNEITIYIRARQ